MVTFVAEGDPAYPQSFILEKGATVPLLTPSKDSYRFAGWYNGSTAWNVATDVPTKNMTLTAAWTPIPTYRVIFDTNGGSTVAVQTVEEDKYVKAVGEPTFADHRFLGWYWGETEWDFNTMTVSADKVSNGTITLTAKWMPLVRIVFNNTDGSRIFARTIDKGTLIPVYNGIPTNKNHRFDGWVIENTDTKWDFETMPANDHVVLVPKWVRQYTVTFNTDCEIEIDSQVIDENGFVTRPNTPQRGQQFSFDGWYIENTEIAWVFVGDERMAVTEDVTLVARWSIMTPPDVFIK